MKKIFKNIDPSWKAYALAGSICVILCCFLLHMSAVFSWIGKVLKVFSPIFIGAIIAVVLNPLVSSMKRRVFGKMKRDQTAWALSVIITVILLLAFIAVIMMMIVPQLVSNVRGLMASIPLYENNLLKIASSFDEPISGMIDSFISSLAGSGGIVNSILSSFLSNTQSLLNKTMVYGSKALNFIISFILALYFLLAKGRIKAVFSHLFDLLLTPAVYYKLSYISKKLNDIFSKYIFFQLVDSLIIGICTYVFMLLTHMPSALIISVFVALTNLVPTFGPFIGYGAGIVLILITKPESLILFIISGCVMQVLDAYVIKPRLFGNALNVPGVIILASIIVLGKKFGIIGALLAIPIASILVFAYRELLLPWLELKRDVKEYNKEIEHEKAEEAAEQQKKELT